MTNSKINTIIHNIISLQSQCHNTQVLEISLLAVISICILISIFFISDSLGATSIPRKEVVAILVCLFLACGFAFEFAKLGTTMTNNKNKIAKLDTQLKKQLYITNSSIIKLKHKNSKVILISKQNNNANFVPIGIIQHDKYTAVTNVGRQYQQLLSKAMTITNHTRLKTSNFSYDKYYNLRLTFEYKNHMYILSFKTNNIREINIAIN